MIRQRRSMESPTDCSHAFGYCRSKDGLECNEVQMDGIDREASMQLVDEVIRAWAEDPAPENGDRLAAALYEQHSAVIELQNKLDERITQLEAAIREACDEWEECLAYVPSYFREKWDYDKSLATLRGVISATTHD